MKKIKVALMYDFDKTLSSKDMQEFNFIPSLGYEKAEDFWAEVSVVAKDQKMDRILAYLYMMLKKSQDRSQPIRREDFEKLGKGVQLYPGVSTWFERIRAIGESLGLEIEHYIISSGLKEIIDGTAIAEEFKKIYACRFFYDENQIARWPSLVVNYTTKTQYIFRINKQILEEDEDQALNEYVDEDKRPVPFSRMIYVGDGLTDVPCMKLVKEKGGQSIVVYDQDKEIAQSLIQQGRANYMCTANYTKGKQMEKLVSTILEKIKVEAELEELEGER